MSNIKDWGLAPLLFGIVLIAMRFGGPIGGMKLAFGGDPWQNVKRIRDLETDNPELLRILAASEAERVSRQTREIRFYAVIGAALYLFAVGGFVWKVRVSSGQQRVVYGLGVLACAAILAYAISISQQPLGPG